MCWHTHPREGNEDGDYGKEGRPPHRARRKWEERDAAVDVSNGVMMVGSRNNGDGDEQKEEQRREKRGRREWMGADMEMEKGGAMRRGNGWREGERKAGDEGKLREGEVRGGDRGRRWGAGG
ncbi:hypothetical protein Tco_0752978 [Tanacetum coccineum]